MPRNDQSRDGSGREVERLRKELADAERRIEALRREVAERDEIADVILMDQERQRQLLEVGPEPIVYYDLSGAVMYVNPAFEETFGFSREDVLGRDIDFIPTDRQAEYDEMLERMREGQPGRSTETKRLTRYGVDLDVLLSVVPLRDESGECTGHIEFLTDITENKMLEETLRSVQERYQILLEVSPDPVVVFDFVGGLAYANPAFERSLGWDQAELIGRQCDELLVPPEDLEAHRALVERVLEGEKFVQEGRRRTRDGQVQDMLLSIAPYRGQGQEVVGHMEVMRDISDRKRAEEALRMAKEAADEANRAKSEFLAMMSHEIRTPMNAIVGMAEVSLDMAQDNQLCEYLEVIKDSSHHLLSLINNVLDFSRIEARKVELEDKDFSLEQVFAATLKSLGFLARLKGLHLNLDVAPDVPKALRGDAARLRQVLVNLLGNALKFTDRGSVSLRVERGPDADRDGTVLRFTVSDTGAGIPEDKLEAIFERFVQAGDGVGRRAGGTGLGLAICRQLVSLMGGDIAVRSTVGQGSEFVFTARFGRAGGSLEAGAAPQPERARAVGPLRVLLVEDNELNAMVGVLQLGRLGHATHTVRSGAEAMQRLAEERYDVVLMDVEMPDMDGMEATRRIREGEAGEAARGVPVVAMTAHALASTRDACLEAGMDGFVTKPVEGKTLNAALAGVLVPRPPGPADWAAGVAAQEESVDGMEQGEPLWDKAEAMERLGADEESMGHICGVFLKELQQGLRQFRLALDRGDMVEVARLAHTLKSTSATIGAKSCRCLAARLEGEARNGDAQAVDQTFPRLEAEVGRLRQVLQE